MKSTPVLISTMVILSCGMQSCWRIGTDKILESATGDTYNEHYVKCSEYPKKDKYEYNCNLYYVAACYPGRRVNDPDYCYVSQQANYGKIVAEFPNGSKLDIAVGEKGSFCFSIDDRYYTEEPDQESVSYFTRRLKSKIKIRANKLILGTIPLKSFNNWQKKKVFIAEARQKKKVFIAEARKVLRMKSGKKCISLLEKYGMVESREIKLKMNASTDYDLLKLLRSCAKEYKEKELEAQRKKELEEWRKKTIEKSKIKERSQKCFEDIKQMRPVFLSKYLAARADIHLREKPTKNSESIAKIERGEIVSVVPKDNAERCIDLITPKKENGFIWVKYMRLKRMGWVKRNKLQIFEYAADKRKLEDIIIATAQDLVANERMQKVYTVPMRRHGGTREIVSNKYYQHLRNESEARCDMVRMLTFFLARFGEKSTLRLMQSIVDTTGMYLTKDFVNTIKRCPSRI